MLLAGNPVFYKRTKHIAVVQLHSKQSLPRHITFVAIIFGINQDEEAYSEILEIVEETYEDMKWYKKWLVVASISSHLPMSMKAFLIPAFPPLTLSSWLGSGLRDTF